VGHRDCIEIDQKGKFGWSHTSNINVGEEMGMLKLYRSRGKNKMDQVQPKTCVQGNGCKARVQFLEITTILGPYSFDVRSWWASD
jgi:hypothetical protein